MAQFTRRSLLATVSACFPWLGLRTAFSSGWDASAASAARINLLPSAPTSGATLAWFTDVAGRSSFAYRTNNDFTGRKYIPQPMCGGVAAIDYDNDGKMDLFFTNGANLADLKKAAPAYFNCLLRNNGDGTFEDVTAKAGLSGTDLGFCFGVAASYYDNPPGPLHLQRR